MARRNSKEEYWFKKYTDNITAEVIANRNHLGELTEQIAIYNARLGKLEGQQKVLMVIVPGVTALVGAAIGALIVSLA